MLDIAIPALTILSSLGVAVFASGRIMGKLCERIDKHDEELKTLPALRNEVNTLNNGIGHDIAAVKQSISVIEANMLHLSSDDVNQNKKLEELHKCLGSVKVDVSYMRGAMNTLHGEENQNHNRRAGDKDGQNHG